MPHQTYAPWAGMNTPSRGQNRTGEARRITGLAIDPTAPAAMQDTSPTKGGHHGR